MVSQTIKSTSPKRTMTLAKKLGQNLRGGEVIELISDLGGGKTTLVKGLVTGLGYQGLVQSPSFGLSHQYKTKNLTLHHFDFYRLSQPGIMRRELAEVLTEPKAIIVVEWPEIVEAVLPKQKLSVRLKVVGESERDLVFNCPDELAYLMLGLK